MSAEVDNCRKVMLRPGDIMILPPGTNCLATVQSGTEFTSSYLTPAALALAEDGAYEKSEIIPRPAIRDVKLRHLLSLLQLELNSGLASGPLFGESLGIALAAHLLRHYAAPVRMREYRGGMPRYRLRRTIDYIQSNLGTNLSVAELAANAQMSRYHFCHLFKRSTGLSPHSYITRERIMRARQMLREKQLRLVDIALMLGFTDHSHFTRTFRQLVGVTPMAYQDAFR
jgi:AraC family transcriptional regulator